MKRLIVFSIMVIFALQLLAQHGGGDFEMLIKYNSEPTQENLTAAIEYYHELLDSDQAEMAEIALANLHHIAMNNHIDNLQQNVKDLKLASQFQLANILLESNRFDESIEIYERINQEAPKWSCPWRHKGEALLKSGKLEAAEIATQEAIVTRDGHYDAYIQLAKVQKKLGKYEAALKTIKTSEEFITDHSAEEVDNTEVEKMKQELEELLNK